MEETYSKAYTQVYVILKHLSKNALIKIPTEVFADVKNRMDKDYKFELNEGTNFEEENILDETKAILSSIYSKYWSSSEEVSTEESNNIDKIETIEENKNIEEDNSNNIYESSTDENSEKDISSEIEETNVLEKENNIVVYKESVFRKIINILKKLFGKNR